MKIIYEAGDCVILRSSGEVFVVLRTENDHADQVLELHSGFHYAAKVDPSPFLEAVCDMVGTVKGVAVLPQNVYHAEGAGTDVLAEELHLSLERPLRFRYCTDAEDYKRFIRSLADVPESTESFEAGGGEQ